MKPRLAVRHPQPTQPARLPLWRRPLPRAVSAATLLVVLGLVAWLGLNVRLGEIVSESMEPTLQPGDVYVIRLDAYRHASPQRGDIVVIRHPEGQELLVKRVIAVGGDVVGVRMGRVWLNGTWLEEPYIARGPGVLEWPLLIRVPEGELFLLGDNRNFSEDSRDMGTLPARDVIGRVVAIILPLHRRHQL